MDDDRRESRRTTHDTTVVTTGGGGGGAGTVIAVVLAIVLIGLLLLVVFGGWLGSTAGDVDVPEEIGVNIDVGGAEMPEVAIPETDAPADGEESGNGN